VSGGIEERALALSAAALTVLAVVSVGGWAVREATDEDPTRLELALPCLEREYGLDVVVPSGDPLADSAPGGAFRTTIGGNVVVVSFWNDGNAAAETIETYERLTPENLEGRAIVGGRLAILWAEPPTGEQSTVLYGCVA
jgi:hypothetical protein